MFFQSTRSKPRLQQICQIQVQGQVCVSHFVGPHCCKHAVLLKHPLWLKARKLTSSHVKIKSMHICKRSNENTFFFLSPFIAWPMSAEGVFKEALLFCLLIESLLESHSWISLAGQSGKAWWDVARPICSGEFCGWMGFQIWQCPAQIYLCTLPLCSQITHSLVQK